ncbi:DegT/DnrJ/EryC1/StrS aminotransferase family protein [Acanthopleuribacter pedis]|uniref:Aminotransferase class I/II-fold pyridoxal phosphate-dependent enzyme n=1 Tax=Acanthopleuribacter pedis TaxID=442870 RepID=A0A8J7Q8Y4_9BACT|nr:DegT/DnrJ/EryC1/StrS family aminotransferase [Acanthopleuribacter pedis]MBO1319114.1 aminotransferase class I/II-fold pyridoxal phosphate-dependent enzyme [Acanthopleuribacter pedis]
MNTYRKKNYRGKRSYSGRPHRRSVDNYHQPLPPEKESIPYARHTLTKPDVEAVVEALLSGTLTQGKELERFEALLSKLTHSDHAIAVNSGTAAVHAALACLKLEPEDEVITSTLNFCAITNMVRLVGATPVLVDCDPETLTLSVEAARAAVTPNTKAIFTNNFGGHASDLTALRELCDEHALMLIEDACHGLGGKYRGHYVGNQADITCFSFHPSKAITTCEGGAVTTNNRAIAEWIRVFRQHGIQKDKRHFTSGDTMPAFHQELQFPGMNYRMSELHAALGRSQLTRLDRHIERRRSIAQVYFQKLGNIAELKLPFVAEWADSAYHLFPIQFVGALENKRDEIYAALRENNIEAQLHYIPVHRMPLYAGKLGQPEQFPNAEAYYSRAISMPLFPDLSYKEIERITELLLKIIGKFLKTEDGAEETPSTESLTNAEAQTADDAQDDRFDEDDFEDDDEAMEDEEEDDDDRADESFDQEFEGDDEDDDADMDADEQDHGEETFPEEEPESAETTRQPEVSEPKTDEPEESSAQAAEAAPVEPTKPTRPPALSLEAATESDEAASAAAPESDQTEAPAEEAPAKPKSTTRRTRAGRPKKETKDGEEAPPKKTRTTSRRTTRAKKSADDEAKATEAKSSTGRLRKVPKGDEEEGEAPKPKRTTRTRSRKAVQNSEDGEKAPPRKRATRPRKSTKSASESDADASSKTPDPSGDEASE